MEQPPLRRAQYCTIETLAPATLGHNLCVRVLNVREVINRVSIDGSLDRLAEVTLGDATGCVILRARVAQIDVLREHENVVLRNARVLLHHGFMRVEVSRWGKIAPYPDGLESTPAPPTEVLEAKNVSMIKYELIEEQMEFEAGRAARMELLQEEAVADAEAAPHGTAETTGKDEGGASSGA